MADKYDTVDDYIASFPDTVRPVLEQARGVIRRAIPGVQESVSYNMATFSMDDRYLVYLAGWKKHISLHAVPDLSGELEGAVAPHRSGHGTVKFPLKRPIPLELIERIVAEMVQQRSRRPS